MQHTWRHQVYRQLDPAAWRPRGLSPVNVLVAVAVLLSVAMAILETEPTIYLPNQSEFELIEYSLTVAFTLEYLARLWSSAEAPGAQPAWLKRVKFGFSLAALLDLVVVVVAWAPFITTNLAVLRVVRLARIVRLAKLGRFSRAAEHLHYAVTSRAYELLLTMSLALVLLIVGASALYWAEGTVQPDKFGSIPRALWWAAVTLTTIGYGDVSPVTALGRFIAVLVAVSGIGLVALPTGILAAAFSEAVQRDKRAECEAS